MIPPRAISNLGRLVQAGWGPDDRLFLETFNLDSYELWSPLIYRPCWFTESKDLKLFKCYTKNHEKFLIKRELCAHWLPIMIFTDNIDQDQRRSLSYKGMPLTPRAEKRLYIYINLHYSNGILFYNEQQLNVIETNILTKK